MSDDLVNGWDELKDTLPYDHAVAAELLFDYGDKLADRIETLTAERDAAQARADALAVKLEKAVLALENIECEIMIDEEGSSGPSDAAREARATLAQITGGKTDG